MIEQDTASAGDLYPERDGNFVSLDFDLYPERDGNFVSLDFYSSYTDGRYDPEGDRILVSSCSYGLSDPEGEPNVLSDPEGEECFLRARGRRLASFYLIELPSGRLIG